MEIINTQPKVLRLKAFVWLQLVFHACFLLSATLTPSIVTANDELRFLQRPASQSGLQTQDYVLSPGETTASVAKKFNISLDELRKLNQFRTYARDFEQLQPGEKLEVPLAPLPPVQWHEPGQRATPVPLKQDDTQAKKIAGLASQTGSQLSHNKSSDAASSLARGMVTNEANAHIQQWLSQFGTARVQLNADENLNLKNSQVDLLVPLYEEPDKLVFTQGSLHRTDDRTQSNVGLGLRWFNDDWMLGGNTFLDYDLSRDHARMGVGIEYWRDFMKLGANSYHRLTGWKDSPDFADFQERPASGWDVRAQGWLPALPQWGGALTFEQYYGNDVALFGKNNRQRDPYAFTAGVNYTPFPLATFNAEQRRGKAGESDASLGVQLNYRLGVPWRQQIDPDAVGAMRQLAGSRYDLVDRNNNIILEYRKNDVISLQTANLVTGFAREKKSLHVTVESKYGLARIDWSAPTLMAAGGLIVPESDDDYSVILPHYQSPQGGNSYIITGVAVDKRGNQSSRTNTQILVTQAAIYAESSTLTPKNISLPADGTAQQQLVLNINDREGIPVDISDSEISVERVGINRASSDTLLTPFIRQTAGEYIATLTAGTYPEAFTITPSARGTRFASANVSVVANSLTARIEAMNVVDDRALADGNAQNSVHLIVSDAQGNRVQNVRVSLQATNQAIVAESVLTDSNGEATVLVTSIRAGSSSLTATVGDSNRRADIHFVSDSSTAHIADADLSVLPEISIADGKTLKTIRAQVIDAQGNPVANIAVGFSADNGAVVAASSVNTDAQGRVETTLLSTVAGISRVTAEVNRQQTTKETVFIGNNASAQVVAVTPASGPYIADGRTPVIFSANVEDSNGNVLSNVVVDWHSDRDSNQVRFSQRQSSTNADGIAQTSITSTQAFAVAVTASSNASTHTASPITFDGDLNNGTIALLTSDRPTLVAGTTDRATVTVRVEDTQGNPLERVSVNFDADNQATITPTQGQTDEQGHVFATLTTLKAGAIQVRATLDNGQTQRLPLNALADTHSATVSLRAASPTAIAGGSGVMLTATAVDGHNNPVPETSIAWRSSNNQLNATVAQTDGVGNASVMLSGTQAGTTEVTALLFNGNSDNAQVQFVSGGAVAELSGLTVHPQSITADGTSAATAQLTLRDTWDNPVLGQTVRWASDEPSITFSATELGDGVYQALVTGRQEGSWTLNATSNDVVKQAKLGLLANQSTALLASVTVVGSTTAKADGIETIRLRAQVQDQNGNTALEGVAVGWQSSLGTLASPLSHTNQEGVAEITLTSTQAGQSTVSAVLGGTQPVTADSLVTFSAGAVAADRSVLMVTPGTIVAALEQATVRIVVRDTEGNLLGNLSDRITLTYTPELLMSTGMFTEVANGVYIAMVTGNRAGMTTVSAVVDGVTLNQQGSLTVKADNSTAAIQGEIVVTPTSAVVGERVTYTATLVDGHGNALGAGIPVTWSANEGSALDAPMTHTDDNGSASVTLTRLLVGTAQVSAILPSGATAAPDVMFSAAAADEPGSQLTLEPATIIAGQTTATLRLLLRDKHGNALAGQSVSGVSDNNAVSLGASHEVSDGDYRITVSGERAGDALLSVMVNGSAFSESRMLSVTGDTSSWRLSEVTANTTRFTAGDAQGVTYSARVTDAHGNVLAGVVVSWHLSGQANSFAPTSRTNEDGLATTQVQSQTAGVLRMTVHLDEENSLQAEPVTVIAGAIDDTRSTFSSDRALLGSNGIDAANLTVTLADQYSNPISGKVVTISGAEALSGFTIGAVTDNGNGSYQSQATSMAKGQVTLTAEADGISIGAGITIVVGAVTPELRFANANQQVVFTRNFTASQPVEGLPDGMPQQWSSTDEEVAVVDGSTGIVTLLKSGETTISVYMPGNAQYNPALGSYRLSVAKADPQISAGDGAPINATWSDGKTHSVVARFDNPDAEAMLIAQYGSSDTGVVTVNSEGILTAVRPGNTLITVSTQETEQFRPSEVSVVYILEKGTLSIHFATAEVSTTDEEDFTLQTPEQAVPSDADTLWQSSNSAVINLSAAGVVQGAVSKGQTRLTLSVLANDFYHASTGYHDVLVFSRPLLSVGTVSYISRGSSNTSGAWRPLFTDDSMSVPWSVDNANAFSATRSVVISLKDASGAVLAQQTTTSLNGPQLMTILPAPNFWGKVATLTVVAEGTGALKTEFTKTVTIASAGIADVENFVMGQARVGTVKTSTNESTSYCRATWLAANTEWRGGGDIIFYGGDFSGKTLLSPMTLVIITGIDGYNENQETARLTSSSLNYVHHQVLLEHGPTLRENCWTDHEAAFTASYQIHFGGRSQNFNLIRSAWLGGNSLANAHKSVVFDNINRP